MSKGQKLITAYFVLTYGLPLVANVLFQSGIEATLYMTSVSRAPLTPYAILLLLGSYLVFLALSRGRARRFPRVLFLHKALDWGGGIYLRFRLVFALLAFALSAGTFLSGLNSYRYGAESISELKSLLLLAIITVVPIATADMFYSMFVRGQRVGTMWTRRYLENILMASTLLLSAAGTVTMLTALLASCHALLPGVFGRLIFARQRLDAKQVMRSSAALILILTLFSGAWFVGETIKADNNAAVVADRISRDELAYGFYHLLARLSTYYYSFLYTSGPERTMPNYAVVSPVVFPLQQFWYHADYLAGSPFNVARPEIMSLARLNMLLVYANGPINDRAGASPGLLASFNYVFMFPFNVICCALYLVWVCKVVDALLRQHHFKKLSGFGILLLLGFLHVFFQCPFDLLAVDDGTIYVMVIAAVSLAAEVPAAGVRLWPRSFSAPHNTGIGGRFDSPAAMRPSLKLG